MAPPTASTAGIPASSITTLTTDLNPAYADQTVTLTVTVSPTPVADGTIEIWDSVDPIGSPRWVATLGGSAGSLEIVVTPGHFLDAVATHELTAKFLGTADVAPSESAPYDQVTKADATTTTLDAGATTVGPRAIVTYSVSVSPAPSLPATVTLDVGKDGYTGTNVGIVLDAAGHGTTDVDTTNWPTGVWTARATFTGSVRLLSSTSPDRLLTITAPTDPPPAAGDASTLSRGGQCALDATGNLYCWGPGQGPGVPYPAGPFRTLDGMCAVTIAGQPYCWDRVAYQPTPPDGTFLTASSGTADCGLRTDHTLACWAEAWYMSTSGNPPFGEFASVNVNAGQGCAIEADGHMACWGANGSGEGTPQPGTFLAVSTAPGYDCALRTDHTIICWGSNIYGATTAPDGHYTGIATGAMEACAIRQSDGALVCWGQVDRGAPALTPGPFDQISVGDLFACGRHAGGAIECFGDGTLSGPPVEVNGSIISDPPPGATVGVPYTHQFVANEYPSTTYAVTAGTLPPGLTLSSTGELSGTPSTAGTWSGIRVEGSNGIAPIVRQTFDLTVVAIPVVPGMVTIDGGSGTTRTANVTVQTPALHAVAMRLSNDGTTWMTAGYEPSAAWSLTDAAYGGSGADGQKQVWVSWQAGDGSWTTPATASILLDTTNPTTSDMGSSLPSGTTIESGRIPVRLVWRGSDTGSGVDHYVVEQRTDAGPWATVGSSLGSTFTVRSLAPGHRYRFAVRAVDQAGNTGGWTCCSTFRLTAVQQSNAAVHYKGTWATSTGTIWWSGTARRSSSRGATASFTFTGRSVAWIGLRAPNRGRAQVYVNGVLVATVDLYASTAQRQRVVWSRTWSSAATRTIKIRVLGTAGRPRVDLDGFAVRG